MSNPIENQERRWGGLSEEPGKAARQLQGLARNNPALAARLAEEKPGLPGKLPAEPGSLPGNERLPGEMPGAPRPEPGMKEEPGKIPGAPGEMPGESSLPGKTRQDHDVGLPTWRRGQVVQGQYREAPAPTLGEAELELMGEEAEPPYLLNGALRFYAGVLGYPAEVREQRVGSSAMDDEEAPLELGPWERWYGRVLGYDV